MKKSNILFIVALIIIIILALVFWRSRPRQEKPISDLVLSATSTPTNTPAFDQSISDGTITIAYPAATFSLAVNPTQILVSSYIPPCDPDFNYCLYYIGDEYKGTNFESAGIRVKKRVDISDQNTCLNTPPAGFGTSTVPTTVNTDGDYATSLFDNVGDAAAGHYASGSLYRLYIKNKPTCYEFQTRVGESQFLNYPAGSIKEFTTQDQQSLESQMSQIIKNITVR